MKRRGFTMIELVMVIVVMGILAALAIPRMQRDLRQEASDNILSAIRYTQHLALLDNKNYTSALKWQQKFWRIYFGTCEGKIFYVVGSDANVESATNARVDFSESAIDPSNGKYMWAKDGDKCSGTNHTMAEISPNVFIGKKYGVNKIKPSNGCRNKYIGFDHWGRPYNSKFSYSEQPLNEGLITSICTFAFTLENGESFKISIQPETGYAEIVDQNGS